MILFREKYPSACNAAKAMGIFEELCSKLKRDVNQTYTEQEIRQFVGTLRYQQEFAKKNRSMIAFTDLFLFIFAGYLFFDFSITLSATSFGAG